MDSMKLYTNIDFADFLETNTDIELTEFYRPTSSSTSRDKILLLSHMMLKKGYKVGVEIKVAGVQRARRIPLIGMSGKNIYIVKPCLDINKLEENIYIVNDICNSKDINSAPEYTYNPIIIYEGLRHTRIASLAKSMNIAIMNYEELYGALN